MKRSADTARHARLTRSRSQSPASSDDVARNVAREDEDVLQHQPDLAAQVLGRDVPDVDAVDQDPAPLGIVEPQQQVYHRGLAAAGHPRQGETHAPGDVEGDVLEDVVVVAGVREPDVLEGYAGLEPGPGHRLRGLGNPLLHDEQPEDALGAGDRPLDRGDLLGGQVDRLEEHPDVRDEHHQRAYGQAADSRRRSSGPGAAAGAPRRIAATPTHLTPK